MKLAKVLVPFEDLVEGVIRNVGDSFDCEDSRAEYLVELRLIEATDKPRAKRKSKKED